MQIELTDEEVTLIHGALLFQLVITKDNVESGKWTDAIEYADMSELLEDADEAAAFQMRTAALMVKFGAFKS